MSKYQFLDRRVPIEDGNIALVQDLSKCKNCSLCRKACAVDMGVFDYYDLTTNGDHPICIHCGQCASICPFDSINERSEIDEVKAAIADPNKIVVFQTAPAVRVGLGEEFGLDAGTFVEEMWHPHHVALQKVAAHEHAVSCNAAGEEEGRQGILHAHLVGKEYCMPTLWEVSIDRPRR